MMYLENISAIRRKKGYSQNKIAELLNIPQQQYSRYERGENEIPLRYIIQLAEIYEISIDELLGRKLVHK